MRNFIALPEYSRSSSSYLVICILFLIEGDDFQAYSQICRSPRPLWRPGLEPVLELPGYLLHCSHPARAGGLPSLRFHTPIVCGHAGMSASARAAPPESRVQRDPERSSLMYKIRTLTDLGRGIAARGAGVFLDVEGSTTWKRPIDVST